MEDINLDFLTTPPRREQQLERLPTPLVPNRVDITFAKKKSHKKKLEIAQKLAHVDELVREIETLKLNNSELQKQLKDFQKSAKQVQQLYNEEKQQNEEIKQNFNHFKQQYDKIDIELTSKTMQYAQLEARLANYEGRPIDYDDLVIKFIRLVKRLEADDCLKYFQEKCLVEELKQYCIRMKLKLPIIKSPQKQKPRSSKPKTKDASVQCSNTEVQHVTPKCKPEVKEQYTQSKLLPDDSFNNSEKHPPIRRSDLREQSIQCQVASRDQASQYISTMITRQTNTEKVLQRHVSTMFPESKSVPPINDILNVFCKWADIRSVTPLEDSPLRKETKKPLNTLISTGTCTMLCNIRRKIDYLPPTSTGIKQELNTPSPSPIPTSVTTSAMSSNGSRMNNISQTSTSINSNINSQNNLPNAILTLFNATSNSALGQLSATAFNELWQIFGTMLLSLLQTSNAGIANINHNAINQQQFLDWLLDLYMRSQLSESNNTEIPSVSQQVNSTQNRPLRFNNSSVVSSSNIIRPQAKKSINKGLFASRDNNIDEPLETSGGNHNYEPSTSTNLTPSYTTAGIVENFSQDSNSMDREIQQIQASTNTVEMQTDICESNANQFSNTNEILTINSGVNQNKLNLEAKIQELFPEVKLNKNKRKSLKRLLKGAKNKKKTKKNNHIETAVDFLKRFAQEQGNFENNELNYQDKEANGEEFNIPDNCLTNNSEKAISYEESLVYTDNDQHYLKPLTNSINNDFTFIKPHNIQQNTKSIKDSSNINFVKPAQKLKKSNVKTRVENKYQMLFGESDSEIDEEEIPKLNKKPVIDAIATVTNDIKTIDRSSEDYIEGEQHNFVEPTTTTSEPSYLNFPISNTFPNMDKTCQQMNQTNQGNFSIPQISSSLLDSLENTSLFKNLEKVSQFSNANDLFFDKMLQENQASLNNLTEQYVEIQTTTTEIDSTEAYGNNPINIEKDLELSSDDEIIKENRIHAIENELKECQIDTFSLPNLLDTNTISKHEIIASTIKTSFTNNNNLDNCYSIGSLPTINDNTTEKEMEPKENHRLNMEDNSNNLKQTKPIETDKQAKSKTCSVYESDFEKDFELSSDNESELAEVDNQLNKDNTHTVNEKDTSNNKNNSLSANENDNNIKYALEDLEEEEIQDIQQTQNNLLSSTTNQTANVNKQKNFFTEFITESEENSIPFITPQDFTSLESRQHIKQLSPHNSIPDRIEQDLRDFRTLQNSPLIELEASLTSLEGSDNVEQDFKGIQDEQNGENFKHEKYNSAKTEHELKANDKLQSASFIKSKENISSNENQDFYQVNNEELPHLSKIVNNIQKSENNINATNCTASLNPLPDFNNTSVKNKNLSNTKTISKLTNEEKLNKTDQLKISENNSNDDNTLCWSTIIVSDTTDSNYTQSSTSEDEDISIIEISSDVTGLNHSIRPLESPIENDLIIDEDYIDIANEKNYLSSDHEHIVETVFKEDHNYYKTKPKKLKTEHLTDNKIYDVESKNETLNTSNISLILDSSLYNEILTDSIKPLSNNMLKDDDILTTPTADIKPKRGRKRKSECSPNEFTTITQFCKRSQRLKAKQIVLEESLNLSATPIKIGKYTRTQKMSTHVEEIIKNKNLNQMKSKEDNEKIIKNICTNNDLKNNLPLIQMGFFKERIVEEDSNKEIISFNKETNTTHLKTITKNKLKNTIPQSTADNNNIRKEILLNDESIMKKSSEYVNKQNKVDVDYVNMLMESSEDTIISSQSLSENSNPIIANNQSSTPEKDTLNTEFWKYSESPKSPPPPPQTENDHDDSLNKTYIIIPLESKSENIAENQKYDTLFDTLLKSYTMQHQKNIQTPGTKVLKYEQTILEKLEKELKLYCYNEMELDPDHMAFKLINKLIQITDNYDLIQKALLKTVQKATSLKVPECELPSVIQEMPPRHLSCCLQRLFVALKHFLHKNSNFCTELILKIEALLFNKQQTEKLSLDATLNLTQLYLLTCKQQETLELSKHPLRMFIAKSLYYYNQKAKLMTHEVLLWYPTVLPHREDNSYDRSDALITVIQEILMNTKYDMYNEDCRDKSLLSKLRYEYHFEPYKPTLDEVIVNLVDKLDNSKFYNISLAFGLLCKRLDPKKVQELLLQTKLLPLAAQYYNKASVTLAYDVRISVLLTIISTIVKPFPLYTNVEIYLNEFSRFLNSFDRQVIQEAALCAILRLQRFGCVNCYNLLRHFKPTYNLEPHTQAMLDTFLYRKPITFWKTIKSQNPNN